MPLLKRETDVYPTDLFELSEEEYPWRVAHVRSRQEKALARHLVGREIPFYLPLREKRKARARRVFVSFLPLFPGYLFFRGPDPHCSAALRSHLVVKLLEVTDPGVLAAELKQLKALQDSGASLTVCPVIAPGDRVRVVDGPFAGYTGVVLRGADRPRLVVSISMLKKSVTVEFDREALFVSRDISGIGRARSAVA